MPNNVFIVGLMGVGKTTVGRLLAQLLALPFFDSDQEIEKRAGAPIAWIFDMEGEEGFRTREAATIDELSQRDGVVLATGGGAVLRADNRERLAARGTVVYLRGAIDHLVRRTARDRKRPLLQNANPREVLTRLDQERDPLYREIADLIFFTDRRPAKSLVQDIAAAILQEQAKHCDRASAGAHSNPNAGDPPQHNR